MAYREGTCDEEALIDNFRDHYFLKVVPEYKLKPEDIILDIGAHIGAYAVSVASELRRCKVFALEPSKENFEYLERNVALNNLSNVIVSNLALYDFQGTASLYHCKGSWGHTISKKISDDYEEVKTDTLTNFIQDNNIICCNFMKMNCEGAEFKIVLSTPKEFLKKIEIVCISYHLDKTEGYSENDLIKYLQNCGFYAVIREKSPLRGVIVGY